MSRVYNRQSLGLFRQSRLSRQLGEKNAVFGAGYLPLPRAKGRRQLGREALTIPNNEKAARVHNAGGFE
jgi:hypothetical protein